VAQPTVDWIMLIPSPTSPHNTTVIKPVEPVLLMPFTVLWMPDQAQSAAAAASSTPRSLPTRRRAG
jgi:hypothetical protein